MMTLPELHNRDDLLRLFHELLTILVLIRGHTFNILNAAHYRAGFPDEIINWLQKDIILFDNWCTNLNNLRNSDKRDLNDKQLCQCFISTLKGMEGVIERSGNLENVYSLKNSQNRIAKDIRRQISRMHLYYKNLHKFLET